MSEATRPAVVPEILRRQANVHGDRPAIVVDRGGPLDAPAALSFSGWARAADALAGALAGRGVRKGDRVALVFENGDADRFHVGYFAALAAGAVAVPVGVRLAGAEMDRILHHAEPRLALGGLRQAEAISRLGVPGLTVLGPAEVDEAIAGGLPAPEVALGPEDLADILYTSGTTGTPKGVCSTHGNLLTIHAGGFKPFAGRVWLHGVPVHTFAGTHAMQYLPLRAGMTIVVQHQFDPLRWLALAASRQAAVAYAVPAMLRLIVDAWDATPPTKRPDLSSLAMLLFGAAAMPPATFARLPELFPAAMLVNLYGLTESGSATCAMPPGEAAARPGSVGVPVPPTEVRVVAEGERECAPGEVGEIRIRGPGSVRRYYRAPEETARTFLPGGWVRTGDLGHLDADGYLYLDGRQKELVNRGGLKVFVDELDSLLAAHPAVLEAAVAGVAHPVLGEDLAAYVVVRPGHAVSADELCAFLAARVADYKVPRRWTFVAALPRNSMGKVMRRQLAGLAPLPGG